MYKERRHVVAANKFCLVGPNTVYPSAKELATCHLSGESNYGKAPRFIENLYIYLDNFLLFC